MPNLNGIDLYKTNQTKHISNIHYISPDYAVEGLI